MGQLALYRMYRPQDFNELYGQDHIAQTLSNAVKSGSFSHAYIFCGPRGTGKTSAARILARAINCEKPKDGNPDNSCPSCISINDNKSMDIIELDAASHTQVDNIREVIIERAHFAPTNLKYKVYIIDEAHMLSKSSFNALLKTLEEPPEHTIFILATTEIHKIPSTIISRCQRFDFKRIDAKSLEKRLSFIAEKEKIVISSDAINLIAKISDGGFRDAISYLDQISSLGLDKIDIEKVQEIIGISDVLGVEDYIFALVEKDSSKGLEIIRSVVDDGHDINQFYKNVIEYIRKLLLASVTGVNEIDFSSESIKTVKKFLDVIKTDDLIIMLDIFLAAEQTFRYSSLPQLGIEVSTINICLGQKTKIVESGKSEKTTTDTPPKISKEATEQKANKVAPKKMTQEKWQQLLMEVKSRNNSIHAFLRVCDPEFENNSLCLYFPYKFHKERIEDPKNRRVVEDAVERVYGSTFLVKCVIRSNNNHEAMPDSAKKDDLLDDALEIFGGEVID